MAPATQKHVHFCIDPFPYPSFQKRWDLSRHVSRVGIIEQIVRSSFEENLKDYEERASVTLSQEWKEQLWDSSGKDLIIAKVHTAYIRAMHHHVLSGFSDDQIASMLDEYLRTEKRPEPISEVMRSKTVELSQSLQRETNSRQFEEWLESIFDRLKICKK